MTETYSPVLVRMTNEQKDLLLKHAKQNGRTLTGEINARLKTSLGAHGPTLQGILAREAEAKAAAYRGDPKEALPPSDNGTAAAPPSDLDRAMLQVFHAMPVEKQLALLSLFK